MPRGKQRCEHCSPPLAAPTTAPPEMWPGGKGRCKIHQLRGELHSWLHIFLKNAQPAAQKVRCANSDQWVGDAKLRSILCLDR